MKSEFQNEKKPLWSQASMSRMKTEKMAELPSWAIENHLQIPDLGPGHETGNMYPIGFQIYSKLVTVTFFPLPLL